MQSMLGKGCTQESTILLKTMPSCNVPWYLLLGISPLCRHHRSGITIFVWLLLEPAIFIKYYFGIHCLCIYYTDKFSSFLLSDGESYLLFKYIWFTYVFYTDKGSFSNFITKAQNMLKNHSPRWPLCRPKPVK